VQAPDHVPADRIVDFDMYAPPDVASGFHDAWLKLQREDGPALVWTPRNEGHWIATRGTLIARIFEDYERFSSRVIVLPKSDGENHKLIPTTIDPPEHRPYRMLLNANLSPKTIAAMKEDIRAVARALVDEIAPLGSVDFISAYAEKFPIMIFLKIVDLPLEDAPRLKYLTDQTTRPDGSMPFEDAIQAFFGYLDAVVTERRGTDRTDMLSLMINGHVDGRKLTHEEALQVCAQILIAGLDTVVNFLGFVFETLARDTALRRRLNDNPQERSRAVEEFFRRYPVVTVAREVRADIDIDGVTLKAGDMVAIPTALHGLDPAQNKCPMQFDMDRTDRNHVTFGNGSHKCPGAFLARAEIEITIDEWLKAIPEFEIAADAKITHAGGIVGCLTTLPLVWQTD